MGARILKIDRLEDAEESLRTIGVDERSLPILAPKCIGLAIKIEKVKIPACNILKQLMLSLGGDAAVAKDVLTYGCQQSDLILIGTLVQIRRLIEKLGEYPGEEFGLKKLREEISEILTQYFEPKEFTYSFERFSLNLSERTHLIGIVNCTPDSFSDGGLYLDKSRAVERVLELVEEGADIVDIGGESTRPGSDPIPETEELKRVIPVVESVASKISVPISIDTYKSRVAKEAIEAGASLVNDISALRFDSKMYEVVAEYDVPVILMHMKGKPKDMQTNPLYSDLIGEITAFLRERISYCQSKGIEKLIVDPGIGFGKQYHHNLTILKRLSELRSLGKPILVGTSRKSFIGHVLDLPVGERLEGTLATIAVAILNGANIIRVHDVRPAIRVARMVDSLK